MSATTPRSTRRAERGSLPALAAAAALTALAGAALLAGCASAPSHFYTLSGDAGTVTARRSLPANPAFLIQVPAVNVPEQAAKNQLVVQRGESRVNVLEEHRWASPLANEIRRALSSALTRRLGTIDLADAPAPPGVPVYRVSVDVQRFESWPSDKAALDAVWSVRSLATQSMMTCRSTLVEKVGSGYDALVAGHQQAVGELAARIATGVHVMAAQPAPPKFSVKGAAPMPVAVRCPSEVADADRPAEPRHSAWAGTGAAHRALPPRLEFPPETSPRRGFDNSCYTAPEPPSDEPVGLPFPQRLTILVFRSADSRTKSV